MTTQAGCADRRAMTIALPGRRFDVRSGDRELDLSRLTHPTDGQPTVQGRPAATPPPATTVAPLEQVHSLQVEFEASWAAATAAEVEGLNESSTSMTKPIDRDGSLVAALRRGDPTAAEDLVAAYGDRAWRLAMRITANA